MRYSLVTTPSAVVTVADYYTDDLPEQKDAFALWETEDLVLYLFFDGLLGMHVAHIDVLNPDGGLYAASDLAFDTRTSEETEADVPGFGTMTIVPTRDTPLGARIEYFLPVAGTPITAYGLTGRWSVLLSLDETTAPLAATTFTLVGDD